MMMTLSSKKHYTKQHQQQIVSTVTCILLLFVLLLLHNEHVTIVVQSFQTSSYGVGGTASRTIQYNNEYNGNNNDRYCSLYYNHQQQLFLFPIRHSTTTIMTTAKVKATRRIVSSLAYINQHHSFARQKVDRFYSSSIQKQQQSSLLQMTSVPTGTITDNNDDDDKTDNDIDNSNKNNTNNSILKFLQIRIQLAKTKFIQRPITYLLIPIIAGIVGWFTNWLAVQMIFYPINYYGISLYRQIDVPLGFIGWQGIVPCKTIKMSTAIVDMVTTQLLTVSQAFYLLNPNDIATLLVPELQKIINDIHPIFLKMLPNFLYKKLCTNFIIQFVLQLQQNANSIFNIQNCVLQQMIHDKSKLGELFQIVAQSELNFLTNSGLWFGFLLGIIQMCISLFYNNPWTLSIGGLIVGLATNWLALKWIFQPIDPTRFGPFIIQGQFLRRQKEVAAIFSQYFANNILSSKQIWNTILTDPTTVPTFKNLFTKQLQLFGIKLLKFIPFTSSLLVLPAAIATTTTTTTTTTAATAAATTSATFLSTFADKVLTKLPNHIHVIFPYMDKTLQLESTIRSKMELMPTRKFERVLHPIFEEDELTLIIAGAVLGFLAGLVQQGLETGQIQLPKLTFIKKYYTFVRTRLFTSKNASSNSTITTNDNDDDNLIVTN